MTPSPLPYLREFYEVMGDCGMQRPTWEMFCAHAADNAELWPLVKGGKVVGGVFFKGHTIHIAVKPEWQGRWLTKRLRRAWDTYTHECELFAHPHTTNKAACALAERLGFKFRRHDGEFSIYSKEATCLHN